MSNFRATLTSHGYELLEKIGEGNFAVVYLVQCPKYDQRFVCKIINTTTPFDECEIQLLCSLDHPNIISMYDFFSDAASLYIILEYCSGGSIQDMIDKSGPLDRLELVHCTKQTLLGLDHCHKYRIAHEDIKPANILLDHNHRVKLADFGLSQYIHQGELKNKFSGSRAFASPEFLNGMHYDPFKADIWALGVTCYMMAEGRCPWPLSTMKELTDSIRKCELKFSDSVDPLFKDLVCRMLTTDPEERPDVSSLLQHPAFFPPMKQHNSADITNSAYFMAIQPLFAKKRGFATQNSKKTLISTSLQIMTNKKRNSTSLKTAAKQNAKTFPKL